MNNVAQTRSKLISTAAFPYAIPMLLAVNTSALVALQSVGGIPSWIKSVVAIFLAF